MIDIDEQIRFNNVKISFSRYILNRGKSVFFQLFSILLKKIRELPSFLLLSRITRVWAFDMLQGLQKAEQVYGVSVCRINYIQSGLEALSWKYRIAVIKCVLRIN